MPSWFIAPPLVGPQVVDALKARLAHMEAREAAREQEHSAMAQALAQVGFRGMDGWKELASSRAHATGLVDYMPRAGTAAQFGKQANRSFLGHAEGKRVIRRSCAAVASLFGAHRRGKSWQLRRRALQRRAVLLTLNGTQRRRAVFPTQDLLYGPA